jgi:hypothetical protein
MSSKNNEAKLWQKVKKGLTDCFLTRIESSTINGIPDIHAVHQQEVFWIELKWVRPPCRVSLNCTDRCHCSLNLVHWFLVPRSRPLITGHWSSSRCSGSWDPCTAQRNSRSRFLATNFFLFVRLVAW